MLTRGQAEPAFRHFFRYQGNSIRYQAFQSSEKIYQVSGKIGQVSEPLFQVPGKKNQVSEPFKDVLRGPYEHLNPVFSSTATL